MRNVTGTWKYRRTNKAWYFYSDKYSAYLYPRPIGEAVLGDGLDESLYMYDDKGALLLLERHNGKSVMYRRAHGTTMSEQEEQMAIEFGNNAGLFELSAGGVFEVVMGD